MVRPLDTPHFYFRFQFTKCVISSERVTAEIGRAMKWRKKKEKNTLD